MTSPALHGARRQSGDDLALREHGEQQHRQGDDQRGRGEDVDAAEYYFRTAMRFETAHPGAMWLNRILAIAKGAREKNAVRLEVYEVL